MNQRIKVTIAYDGAAFCGWQLQAEDKERLKPSVQGTLEEALYALGNERVVIHGSGRTDSGVHAEGQVFHFDPPAGRESMDWGRFFTAVLPKAIQVMGVESVDEAFHARFSATGKLYEYCLWSDKQKAHPKLAPYVWSVGPLALEAMEEAASFLVGERNFASFQNHGSDVQDTVRTITALHCQRGRCGPFACPDLPVFTWSIEGNGFLRQMIRNIMGLLVWVGTGKVAIADVPRFIEACERNKLPSPAAPANGLTLAKVYYP